MADQEACIGELEKDKCPTCMEFIQKDAEKIVETCQGRSKKFLSIKLPILSKKSDKVLYQKHVGKTLNIESVKILKINVSVQQLRDCYDDENKAQCKTCVGKVELTLVDKQKIVLTDAEIDLMCTPRYTLHGKPSTFFNGVK